MKKVLILISILVLITGGIVSYSQSKQDTPELEQVNVSEKVAEEVVDDEESNKNETIEDEINSEQEKEEVKEDQEEVKSVSKTSTQNVSSASESVTKTASETNTIVTNNVPKETSKEDNATNTPSSNSANAQTPNSNATTKLYESITGGVKEFSSESEAVARGTEIQNRELDYVLDYNEQHPEAPIQPDINYFRVYPSVIDENGKYWYYLHFFCASGEGNDSKLKSIY